MRQVLRKTWWLACMSTALYGCSSSVEPNTDVRANGAAAVVDVVPTAQSSSTKSLTPELASDQQTSTTIAEFAPPFPGRFELFEPPKRAQGQVRHDDEHGSSVELKGFINVDEPKVVLSIDGVISPVSAGSEKYGVQVIAIEPPSVVLQRGRSRWTATLE